MIKRIFWHGYSLFKEGISWVFYLIFAIYIIYITAQSEAMGAKFIFLSIGVIILSGCIYYEYLKYLYGKMINALTNESNRKKSKDYRQQLINKDRLNGFQQSIVLFDSLLLLDEGDYQGCLIHMEEHQKFFKSSIDYLFIYYHNQLQCAYFLNNKTAGLEVAGKLMELKNLKKKQYSPLFSWNEINGIIYSLNGRNKKAIEELLKVNLALMNNREKAYVYHIIAVSYRNLKDYQKFGEYRKLANEYGPKINSFGGVDRETITS